MAGVHRAWEASSVAWTIGGVGSAVTVSSASAECPAQANSSDCLAELAGPGVARSPFPVAMVRESRRLAALERMAEMATDSLRALILEHFGYRVKVFEFIGGEHTPKNIMITAEKNGNSKASSLLSAIADAKKSLGISRHHLEDSLDL